MTKELVIHVGCYKTGSSSIQNSLYSHRETLVKQGILYASSGQYHGEPEVGIRHSPFVYLFYQKPDSWRQQTARLIEEINNSHASMVILSCEAWSNPSYHTSLAELVNKTVQATGLRTRGIVFFRNRLEYAHALYREFTRRRGNAMPFKLFIRNHPKFFDYCQLLRQYQLIFDSVTTINWNNIELAETEFFNQIGFKAEKPVQRERFNVSIGAVEAEVARVINNFKLADKVNVSAITDDLKKATPQIYSSEFSEHGASECLTSIGNHPKKFEHLSGLSSSECRRIFDLAPKSDYKDVASLTPAIEKLLRAEYLQIC